MISLKQILLIVLFCISSYSGFSQVTSKADGDESNDSLNISEVEVVAFHTPNVLRAVAGAVSVVSIGSAQSGDVNIVSALSASPGVFVQEGSAGTVKLTLRGIGSRYAYGTKKIKMFFDDIPLYSAEGETTFDDINPENLSKMEILRGPASSIYGASLGGTVILYPRRSGINQSEIKLRTTIGSFGYSNHSLIYSNGKGQNDLFISYSMIQSDGYRQNNEYNRNSFFIHYKQTFNKKLTGSLLLTGSIIKSQISSSVDSVTYFTSPASGAPTWIKSRGYEQPNRILGGYKMAYSASLNWNLSASIFGTYRKTEENRPFNFLRESVLSYGTRIMAIYSKNISGIRFQWISGTNLFFERYQGSILENMGGNGVIGSLQQKGKENIYQTDIFTQGEIKIKGITLTAGLNFNISGFTFEDLFSVDTINQTGFYHFQPILSPRVSLAWNPIAGINLYSAVNHGFSVPSLSETLSPLGLINREIKPERALSFEGGLRLTLFRNVTFVDIASYYMIVTDLIVPKRTGEDIYIGMNAGSSLHRGIEISWQQKLFGHKSAIVEKSFSATANLAYSTSKYTFSKFIEDETDYSGRKIPGMPDHNLSARLEAKIKGFYSSFSVISVGKIPLTDGNDRYTNPYVVMNAKAGFEHKFGRNWEINTLVSINNIGNQHYASMVVVNAPGTASRPPRFYYPAMPRWISFSLNIAYTKPKFLIIRN